MGKSKFSQRRWKLCQRRCRVAALAIRQKNEWQIVELLKAEFPDIDVHEVRRDLTCIRKGWHENSLRDLEKIRAEEIARYNKLEEEYWEGFDRSRRDKVERITEQGEEGAYTRKVHRAGQAGNPKWLEGAERCAEKRDRLLGLEPVRRLSVEGIQGMIQVVQMMDGSIPSPPDPLRISPPSAIGGDGASCDCPAGPVGANGNGEVHGNGDGNGHANGNSKR